MISFILNDNQIHYSGNPERSLLDYLRNDLKLYAAKDGCSGQASCGACTVEVNGRARLACSLKMTKLEGSEILTLEGFPIEIKNLIANAFVNKGAVQCGFCTPGIISRTKVLLDNNTQPDLKAIRKALKFHYCRCTGYKKIEEGIMDAAKHLQKDHIPQIKNTTGKIGLPHPKYEAFLTAIGERKFTDDIDTPGMIHGALKFSDHPKARILKINYKKALSLPGVIKIITASDIPGSQKVGLIRKDWSLMVGINELTHYIGDVIAGVLAESEEIARMAVEEIDVEYDVLTPVTDVFEAIKGNPVHHNISNHFETTRFKIGDVEKHFSQAAHSFSGKFKTQRIEHAFIETESAVAIPTEKGIHIYTQSQGIYEDRRQIAMILGLDEAQVRVTQVPNGGAFGGKEDLSIQGHTALFSYLSQKPVKLKLSREDSIRVHPKRHPVFMDMHLSCDEKGKLTALKLIAVGDTGAYASVGAKVMERVGGHATGAYYIPNVDIEAKTVYTNNIPSGAMRGFGANQVNFALESCVDELCKKGAFDPWKFRYDNALTDGLTTATGQKVFGVGVRACLNALKADYDASSIKGLACAIKNSGVGNGMIDESKVLIDIKAADHVLISHGWTEMGQGVHNMALQTLCQETSIDPQIIEVKVDTEAQLKTGMTTSSRATALLGLAVINASKALKEDLNKYQLTELVGKRYKGQFICDWTNKPDAVVDDSIIHYSYGYAAQLCQMDQQGNIEKIVAAHDGGKVMNSMLFEGQIEGGVHMGLGYALRENLPMKDGFLISSKLRDLGMLRAHETPDIKVIPVEVKDPVGPYGAKGIGEIGLVPTASAIANAFCRFDGKRRYELPLEPILKSE